MCKCVPSSKSLLSRGKLLTSLVIQHLDANLNTRKRVPIYLINITVLSYKSTMSVGRTVPTSLAMLIWKKKIACNYNYRRPRMINISKDLLKREKKSQRFSSSFLFFAVSNTKWKNNIRAIGGVDWARGKWPSNGFWKEKKNSIVPGRKGNRELVWIYVLHPRRHMNDCYPSYVRVLFFIISSLCDSFDGIPILKTWFGGELWRYYLKKIKLASSFGLTFFGKFSVHSVRCASLLDNA